ncbi:MAG: response regulator [Bdellovibrionota bacterium]
MNEGVNRSQKTVLIAEDNVQLREALAFKLMRNGFNVLEASDGIEALTQIKGEKIDLVISDIRMPKSDGVELITNIRNIDARMPPVIFLSGYSDLSLEKAYDLGCFDFLSKPFNTKELIEIVKLATELGGIDWINSQIDDGSNIEVLSLDKKDIVIGKLHDPEDVSLGRGGVFIGGSDTSNSVCKEGSLINFDISFKGALLDKISFIGEIIWVRNSPEEGLCPGIGVKFRCMSESSEKKILGCYLEEIPKSFIPIGNN